MCVFLTLCLFEFTLMYPFPHTAIDLLPTLPILTLCEFTLPCLPFPHPAYVDSLVVGAPKGGNATISKGKPPMGNIFLCDLQEMTCEPDPRLPFVSDNGE